jgi:NADH dehydrogenase/NADH:ubiquinone oxidoreductase subunit G
LVDLPESFRDRFGYDPVKANAAEATEKEKKARWQQASAAQAAQLAQQAQDTTPAPSFGDSGYASGANYSAGGSVYVHGYYRKNGTYVSAYTRSSPSHHR